MKTAVVLCMLFAVVLTRPEATYDTRYDDFNAQELVENPRLLTAYGKCFLDKGACTPEGNDFKKIIPDAVQTKCAKCTAKQRSLVRVVIKGFQTKTPSLWQELVKKEDPTGQYKQAFEEFINSSQ